MSTPLLSFRCWFPQWLLSTIQGLGVRLTSGDVTRCRWPHLGAEMEIVVVSGDGGGGKATCRPRHCWRWSVILLWRHCTTWAGPHAVQRCYHSGGRMDFFPPYLCIRWSPAARIKEEENYFVRLILWPRWPGHYCSPCLPVVPSLVGRRGRAGCSPSPFDVCVAFLAASVTSVTHRAARLTSLVRT